MIVAHTIYGDVYAQEAPGYWDEPKIEGHIFYKGFRANYRHGEDPEDRDQVFGWIDNIHNAAYILQGDSMQEYVQQFHEDVEEFLTDIDNGEFGGHPMEYYTDDPDLLSYYNRYHRRKVVRFDPSSLASDWQDEPFRLAA